MKDMKYILYFFLLLFCSCMSTHAQTLGYKTDTSIEVLLKPVEVTATGIWANDTVRYRYNQMRFYVTTILPYVEKASQLFQEINTSISNDNLTRREKRKYIENKEDLLRDEFEDKIRSLNVTQAKLLVKLISRQTGANIYEMLTEFKNPFTALKWQTWARMNGLNLNSIYNPQEEPDLERVMRSLGYPIPNYYSQNK